LRHRRVRVTRSARGWFAVETGVGSLDVWRGEL
jgi:hypothetical protein